MKSMFCILSIILLGLASAQTLEEQQACADDMEVCQAQVTILINSLSNVEATASPGAVQMCDPEKVEEPSDWWKGQLEDFGFTSDGVSELRVCDNKVWGYVNNGDVLSTCVAYENTEFEDPCPSTELYCALNDNQFGYPSHIADALLKALEQSTKSHPQCPRGGCNPLSAYWKTIMMEEGISDADASKLCTYDDEDLDQYYYVENSYSVHNTCVVSGETWDDDCTADRSRVCSALNEGKNVVGWPKQQARMVKVAVENSGKNHPQCTVSSS